MPLLVDGDDPRAPRAEGRHDRADPGREQLTDGAEVIELVLVGHQHVDQRQHLGGQRCGGRRVEHRAHAGRAGEVQGVHDHGEGDLELDQEDVRWWEGRHPDVEVGAGHGDDRVLPVLVDGDHRAAGRTLRRPDPCGVDAGGDEHGAQRVGGVVGAEGTEERCRGAGAGGGNRLVEALAAGVLGVVRTEHGLARRRKARGARDEVEVGAADDAHSPAGGGTWGHRGASSGAVRGVRRRVRGRRSVRSGDNRRRGARLRSHRPRTRTRGAAWRTRDTRR